MENSFENLLEWKEKLQEILTSKINELARRIFQFIENELSKLGGENFDLYSFLNPNYKTYKAHSNVKLKLT